MYESGKVRKVFNFVPVLLPLATSRLDEIFGDVVNVWMNIPYILFHVKFEVDLKVSQ